MREPGYFSSSKSPEAPDSSVTDGSSENSSDASIVQLAFFVRTNLTLIFLLVVLGLPSDIKAIMSSEREQN